MLPTANLETIRTETGFELLLLDVEIPDEFRREVGAGAGHPTSGT